MLLLLDEEKKENWSKSSVFSSFSPCVRAACARIQFFGCSDDKYQILLVRSLRMWKARWTDELAPAVTWRDGGCMLTSKTLGDTSSHKDSHSLRKREQAFAQGQGGNMYLVRKATAWSHLLSLCPGPALSLVKQALFGLSEGPWQGSRL